MSSLHKRVAVIGGGTGIYPTLQGLKKYADVTITAIIAMTDSGGSTGRLRDTFGLLPVGDVRMALAALATEGDEHDELLRRLLLYRFDRGEGFCGHSFGNMLLVALTDILGSEEDAIAATSRILRVRGKVVPVTTDNITLQATYADGSKLVGEHAIDEPPHEYTQQHITELSTTPTAHATSSAIKAIQRADMVVLGPGSFYTSLMANCVIVGIPEALQATAAQFVYMVNLMTTRGQTHNMTVAEHVAEVARYVGRMPDTVIVNAKPIPDAILEQYATQFQYPVVDDADTLDCEVLHTDILDSTPIVAQKGDALQRSLIRGDAHKIAHVLYTCMRHGQPVSQP